MNNRELVVRIIQPAEKPEPPKRPETPVPAEQPVRRRPNLLLTIGLACLAGLGIMVACGFSSFAFPVRDIVIVLGIPLAVGIVATYAIF
jgi:hypothetical protein